MKALFNRVVAAGRRGASRVNVKVAAAVWGVTAVAFGLLAPIASATEPEALTGAKIAEDFTKPGESKFGEALPYLVAFMVAIGIAMFIVRLLRKHTGAKA